MAVAEQPPVHDARSARGRAWPGDRLEPLAPLAGIVAVILLVIATIVIDGANAPENKSPAEEYVAYFRGEQDAILWSSLAFGFGVLFFLWFAGSLRARLAEREGPAHRLSSLSLAGALGMALMLMAAIAPSVSGAILADEEAPLSGEVAQALYWAGDGFWVFSLFMCGLFLVATAAAALRTGLLPKWLGWVTLVMGILAPVWFVGWAIMFFLLPFWIVGVAILLYRAGRAITPA